VSQKNFFKGDKVQLKWNKLGTTLIVLAQTEVDKTGKSYYGETTLYVLSANGGFDSRITLDKEGPIHDVSWSPNSKEFGVVYGYMPAKTTLFNQRAVATYTFPLSPRNTILFSPTGRFVIVAGFGNLAGQMDVYDLEKDYKKICTIESGNPSVCEWSPDSKYILTATTSPRLRVDNGVRLWHVTGGIMYNEDMQELYHVEWRPQQIQPSGDLLSPVPAPHSSAQSFLATVKTPSKPAGAYRPPGARGLATPLAFKREDEGGAAHVVSNGTSLVGANGFGRPRRAVPGAETVDNLPPGATPANAAPAGADGDEGLSKAALKNKKKREAKKAKDAEARAAGLDPSAVPQQPTPNNRSPERPDRRERAHSRSNRHHENNNRTPSSNRFRSNTAQGRHGQPNGNSATSTRQMNDMSIAMPPVQRLQETPALSVTSPGEASPQAKKLRGLQKKIRAIEDLEMRLAGGEKLEDTQMKKIGTKASVQAELDSLER
jgi:translation initiation factor 2A